MTSRPEKKGGFVCYFSRNKRYLDSAAMYLALGISIGKFFKINHHFINVRQFNTASAITISSFQCLTTQRVAQNMDCRGL
jgi:hypothetical protein